MQKTYGTLDWFKGAWVIVNAEPHVLIRLRRVFPRIARRDDFVALADTLETSRELEWFCSRFPLAFKTAAVEGRLAERASQHRDGEALVDRLIKGVQKSQEFRLALPPRDYQKLAGALILNTDGILIGDDLGIGKTVSAICAMTDPRARPCLVITMTHLTSQWESELRKFAPRLTVHVLRGTQPYDLVKACGGKFPEVTVTSYSKIHGWGETLAPLIRYLVLDEAQEMRNGTKTRKGESAHMIARKAKFRCGLTATPTYNLGGEIHPVLEMIRPGALGTRSEFALEWCVGDSEKPGKLRIKDPVAMGTYLRDAGLMIRRTKQDVGRELPKLTRVPHEIDCDMAELKKIEGRAVALAQVIMSKTQGARGEKFQAAQELNNLVRQATGVSKAPFVAEFVRMLVESDECVVVYAWHRDVYAILMESLSNEKLGDLKPVMYTGSESQAQKAEAKRMFCSGESKVMLMSLRAGAGLDGLQHHCRIGVFAELDWAAGVHEQDEGRIYRDGQPHPVLMYYLLSTSGSDPVISDMLGIKKAQLDGIRDPRGAMEHGFDADGQNVKKLAESYLARHKARG